MLRYLSKLQAACDYKHNIRQVFGIITFCQTGGQTVDMTKWTGYQVNKSVLTWIVLGEDADQQTDAMEGSRFLRWQIRMRQTLFRSLARRVWIKLPALNRRYTPR